MNKSRVAYLLSQAKEHIDQNQRDEALYLIRQALQEDPGEMAITEIILSMERHGTVKKASEETHYQTNESTLERNYSGIMDPKLERAFKLSDDAFSQGNDAKALAYLKKAVSLFPHEPEAAERLSFMKTRIQAGNLVKIGRKKLSEGDIQKAVSASRRAFDLLASAPGLDELLAEIESIRKTETAGKPVRRPEPVEEPEPEIQDEPQGPESGTMLWADRIRAAVKEDRFEEAGKMVAEAVSTYPDDPLLNSFHTKLKRLGFVK